MVRVGKQLSSKVTRYFGSQQDTNRTQNWRHAFYIIPPLVPSSALSGAVGVFGLGVWPALPEPAAPPLLIITMVPEIATPSGPIVDEASGTDQTQLHAGLNDYIHAAIDVHGLAGLHGIGRANLDAFTGTDIQRVSSSHLFGLIAADAEIGV